MLMNNNEKNVRYWYSPCIPNAIRSFRVPVPESTYPNAYLLVERVLTFAQCNCLISID